MLIRRGSFEFCDVIYIRGVASFPFLSKDQNSKIKLFYGYVLLNLGVTNNKFQYDRKYEKQKAPLSGIIA